MDHELRTTAVDLQKAVSSTRSYCELKFPDDLAPRLCIALDRLAHSIDLGLQILASMGSRENAEPFRELCSSDLGMKAMKDAIHYLLTAKQFVSMYASATNCVSIMGVEVRSEGDKTEVLKGDIDMVEAVKGHESAVSKSMNHVHQLFMNSSVALGNSMQLELKKKHTQRLIHDVLIGQMVVAFRTSPFALSYSWRTFKPGDEGPRIFNHYQFSNQEIDRNQAQPAFRVISKQGSSWVCQEIDRIKKLPPLGGDRHIYKTCDSFLTLLGTGATKTSSIATAITSYHGKLIDTIGEIENTKEKVKILAVCGQLSAGKSSLINAIVGRKVLPEHRFPCTGWPLFIKHSTDSEPRLEVDVSHFTPFLEVLKRWYKSHSRKLGPKSDSAGPRDETNHMFAPNVEKVKLVQYDSISLHLQEQLERVASPSFKLNTSSSGDREISQTDDRPDPENKIFPTLHIKFEGIGEELQYLQFVDLPGTNDVNVKNLDIEAIWRSATVDCDAFIYVFQAVASDIQTQSTKDATDIVKRVAGTRPLVVVCTGSDKHHGRSRYKPDGENQVWKSPGDTVELENMVFERVNNPSRIHFCSALLYRSAANTVEYLGDLAKKPPYEDLMKEPRTLCLDKYDGSSGEEDYEDVTIERLKKLAITRQNRAAIHELPSFFDKTLNLDFLDRSYSGAMESVVDALDTLSNELTLLLEVCRTDSRAFELFKQEYDEFRKKCHTVLGEWELGSEDFISKSRDTLESELESAYAKAVVALEEVVKNVAARNDYRGRLVTKTPFKDSYVLLDSREQTLNFLRDIDREVQRRLDVIQEEIVASVRIRAFKAWEERIQSLATLPEFLPELRESEVLESTKSNASETSKSIASEKQNRSPINDKTALREAFCLALKAEVALKLQQTSKEDIATSVAELITTKVHGSKPQPSMVKQLFREFKNPFKARRTATKEEHEKLRSGKKPSKSGSISKEILQDVTEVMVVRGETADGSVTSQVRLDPQSSRGLNAQQAEDVHNRTVNALGYLIRAPVVASIRDCPVTSALWPCLKEKQEGILAAAGKKDRTVQVDVSLVIDNYQNYVLDGWHTIISNESRKSLEGAVDYGSYYAMNKVMETLGDQSARMNAVEEEVKRGEMNEESLVLCQVDFSAARAAAKGLALILSYYKSGGSDTDAPVLITDSNGGIYIRQKVAISLVAETVSEVVIRPF
ncbi:hypothetical protein FRB91_005164 [Serendipita sp. 411]|nr:hypothetical protein FRB91_005164 [Serendipita sp. 411]